MSHWKQANRVHFFWGTPLEARRRQARAVVKGRDKLSKALRNLSDVCLLTPDGRIWQLSPTVGYLAIDASSIAKGLYLPDDWQIQNDRSDGDIMLKKGFDPPTLKTFADYLGAAAVRMKSLSYPSLPEGTNARIFK